MPRVIRSSTRTRRAIAPALAIGLAAGAAMASCVTVPPADPPQVPAQGPVIVQDGVQPPANQYLTELPKEFVVPVRVTNSTSAIACKVFIDFDPGRDNNQFATPAAYSCPNDTLPALDGGLTRLPFTLTTTSFVDPNVCHVIQFFVADSFDPNSAHTPGDSLGADSVTWQYTPNGPGNCQQFDGGDGVFPTDASTDATLQVQAEVGTGL